jgi:hypothetical protein
MKDPIQALSSIVESVTKIGDVFRNLMISIEDAMDAGMRISDKVSLRRTQKRLIRIHQLGTGIGIGQRVAWDQKIEWYYFDPSEAKWEEVCRDLRQLFSDIELLMEEVENENSIVTLEPAYRQLLEGLVQRKEILRSLLKIKAPKTTVELNMLKQIQERYVSLMCDLEKILLSFGDYIKGIKPDERWQR